MSSSSRIPQLGDGVIMQSKKEVKTLILDPISASVVLHMDKGFGPFRPILNQLQYKETKTINLRVRVDKEVRKGVKHAARQNKRGIEGIAHGR